MIRRLDHLSPRHAVACVVALAWAWTGGTASAGPVAPWLSRALVGVIAYGEHGEVLRTGAGLVLSTEGFIATNHHVIEGASRVALEASGGRSLRAPSVLYSDPRRDLAILSGAALSLRVAALEGSDWIDVGEPVLVLQGEGMPGNSELAGRVSGSREDDGALRYIYIQSDELPSAELGGRPIVNEAGSLIGLSIGLLAGSTDMVSAMPVSDLRLALARVRAASALPADRSAGLNAETKPWPRAEADRERPAPAAPVDPGDGPIFPSDATGPLSVIARWSRHDDSQATSAFWIPAPPPLPGPMPAEQVEAANRVRAKMTEIARKAHNVPVFGLDPMTQTQVYFEALRQLGIFR